MSQDNEWEKSSCSEGSDSTESITPPPRKSLRKQTFFRDGNDTAANSSSDSKGRKRKSRDSTDSGAMDTESSSDSISGSPAVATASSLFNKTFAGGVRRVTQEEAEQGLSKKRQDEIIASLQLNHLPFWNEEFQNAMDRYKIKTVSQLLNWNLTNGVLLRLEPRVQTSVLYLREWKTKPKVMAPFLRFCQLRMQTYSNNNNQLNTRRLSGRKKKSIRQEDESDSVSATRSNGTGTDDSVSGATSRKRKSRSQESATEADSVDYDTDDLDGGCLMENIPHLSKKTFDPQTGHPIRHFSVLDQEENIFDFRLNVNTSTIPGSGRGAFLTYLGCRVLKKECRERSKEKMKDRHALIPDTMQPLEAVSADGYGISVKLNGKNLHGNNNLLYWPVTTFNLTATMPSNGTTRSKQVSVKLTGENLHYDSDDEEEYMTHLDMINSFGFLKLHVEDDYVPSSKSFSNKCGVIDLGRYGPWLKSDRKTRTEFDIKDFVFSNEPSGWDFGVNEKLHGEDQIIDVTSDATGEPHVHAQTFGDMMMYVNEVGYNEELQQNVQALEKDGRTVHYYLDVATPMQKNQTVELFVDYHDAYEASRERKGYGKRNLKEGLRGDDHEATRLKRNFLERHDIQHYLENLDVMQLYELVEYLHTKILQPVASVTNDFVQHLQSRTPSPRSIAVQTVKHPSLLQWCARRRLHWISMELGERAWRLEKLSRKAGAGGSKSFPYQGIFDETKKRLKDMEWNHVDGVLKNLNCDEDDAYEKAVYAGLTFEMSEECLFELSKKGLLDAFDESRWCPIAVKLTKSLCEKVYITSTSSQERRLTKERLLELLLTIAGTAADCVRRACQVKSPELLSQLQFESGVQRDRCVNAAYVRQCEIVMGPNALSCENFPQFPMGVLAALGQAHDSSGTPTDRGAGAASTSQNVQVSTDGVFVVTQKNNTTAAPGEPKPRSFRLTPQAIPRKPKDVVDGLATLDEMWYVLWQVVYVVHKFASKVFERKLGSEAVYSLEKLCQATNVDIKDAKKVVETPMKPFDYPELPKIARRRNSPKATNEKKSQKPHSSAGKPRPKAALFHGIVWKALESVGWTLDKGNRPTDYYFLPPGVARGKGFKNRVDFFDSAMQVMNFIETDPRWKDKEEVVAGLKLFRACSKLQDELRFKKRLPKGQVTVEWLVSQVENNK